MGCCAGDGWIVRDYFWVIEAARGGERALIAGIVGVVALVGFFVVESRSDAPMLPLDLFRSRSFCGANLMTLLLYGALSAVLFFLPMNLIQVHHYSSTQAGAALLPWILLMFLLVALVGWFDCQVWCEDAAYCGAVDRRGWVWIVYAWRGRWVLLVDCVSGGGRAWVWDGGKCGSVDDDGDEFDRSEPGGRGFGDQQCILPRRGATSDCGAGACVCDELQQAAGAGDG